MPSALNIDPLVMSSVSKSSIATQVAQELRRRIIAGEYAGGMKLRQEQIALQLNVSRSPLREALRQLEAEGLVIFVPQKGATVAPVALADASELFEMRLLLEPHLLELAVPNMSAAVLDSAERLISQMELAPLSDWGTLNLDLHRHLYEPAQRPAILAVVERVHRKIDQYLRLQIAVTEGRELAKREHGQIVEACRQRRADQAALLLKLHIYNASIALPGRPKT